MIRITDNTLTTFDETLPSKAEILELCELLSKIGVSCIELSQKVFEVMEELPQTNNTVFWLHLESVLEMPRYSDKGFAKYICHNADERFDVISELQLNDIKEIVMLKTKGSLKEIRIVGLDAMLCSNYVSEMSEIKKYLNKSKINFCPENTYKCATALAVQWLLSGGEAVTTSICGRGNKAATEEVIMAIRICMRHKPNQDLSALQDITILFEKMTGVLVDGKKAILGRDIFKVEAGIHADAIIKKPATYEGYDPRIVGAKTELVIGKHSGKNAVKTKILENNIEMQEDSVIRKIIHEVQELSMKKKRSLSDKEFISLVKEVISNEKTKVDC